MRLLHATADQLIYFVAVDATDLKTRKTGLSGFEVFRSRNGGASVEYSTPTVTEVSSSHMPGVYKLLVDEDVSLAALNATEEMVLHITHTGGAMAPVTRVIELFRSEWDRLRSAHSVADSFGSKVDANVKTFDISAITNASFSDNAIDVDVVADGFITAAKFADNAISSDVIANSAINDDGLAATAATEIATRVWQLATSTSTATESGSFGEALTDVSAPAIADAVWDEDISAHQTIGTFGQSGKSHIRLPSGMHRIVRVATARQGFSGSNYISLDATANSANDFYNGMKIIIYAGTGIAVTTERNITDYIGASGDSTAQRCTVDGSTTTTDATSRFIVYEPVRDPDSIADHVWDELKSAHSIVNSFGAGVDATVVGINGNVITHAAIADESFREEHFEADAINAAAIKADAITKIQNGLKTELDSVVTAVGSILVDTAEIGTAGAGLTEAGATGNHLTAIPWNSAWDTEVQSECTGALNAYDPPTKAEMDTAHGLLATVAKQDVIDTNIDQIETAVITNAAGADVAADIIALKAETALIVADTNELQSDDVPGLISALNNISTTEVSTRVDTALSDIHLDHLLAVTYADEGHAASLFRELTEDVGGFRFTAAALAEAPSGSGASASTIATAVWSLATSTSGTTDSGTFGEQVKTDIDAILVDTGTTLPLTLATIDGIADDILADTAVIGVAGAGLTEAGATGDHLTAVPWNAAWDTEVQSEVAEALGVYDSPTKAEMDTAHALLATVAKQDVIDGLVDLIKAQTVDSFAELAQGIPTATPTMEQAIMYLYMALRNKLTVTASEKAVYNDAGTKITKKVLSDDGTTYTEAEAISGA